MSASRQPGAAQARPVRLLAAGGTISMQGEHAVPTLDAAGLIAAIPELARFSDLQAQNVLGLPGPQISLDQGLGLVRQAVDAAARGDGVVITTGTDTLEELAMLAAMTHASEAPIVLTGANRPASAPGADGPANLLDAVAVACAPASAGLGAVVVFGGEILAAASARKFESTGPSAFASPVAGPLGRVVEGRVWLHPRPLSHPALDPPPPRPRPTHHRPHRAHRDRRPRRRRRAAARRGAGRRWPRGGGLRGRTRHAGHAARPARDGRAHPRGDLGGARARVDDARHLWL